MHDQELPWTPEGKKLLSKIKEVIDRNGGMAAMYDMVDAEVNGTEFLNHRSREDQVFRLTIKYDMRHNQACQLIPMPLHIFSQRLAQFKRNNRL